MNLKMKGSVLLVIVLCGISIFFISPLKHKTNPIKINGDFFPVEKEISEFHFMDHTGKMFSKDNLKGHWTLMFFGFTHCAMVCPLNLYTLSEMYQRLEKELLPNQLPAVVFVSIDPQRDTMERLKEYVPAFNAHFIGLRASQAETEALMNQLYIVAAKMQVQGSNDRYTLNHTSEILLINPKGKLLAYFSFPPRVDDLVKDYKLILHNEKD